MPAFVKLIIESASLFGNSYVVAAIASLSMIGYLLVSGYIKEAGLFLFAVSGILYSVLLKNIFKIPRPDTYIGDPGKLGDLYRFPSSHVVFYVCFWGFLLFLTYKKGVFDNTWVIYLLRGLSLYHILLVGASRVYVGAHTVQDVIAGYIFGTMYLAIVITVNLILDKK